jgi:Flp pilus assembly protein TadG
MRDCRGSVAIEFAILFPVMMLVVTGYIELSMVVTSKMQLEFATEAAARCYAIRTCTDADTVTYAAAHLPQALGGSPSNFHLAPPPTLPGDACVTARYTYTPMIWPSNIDILAGACYPMTT